MARNRMKKLVHYVCSLCDDPKKLGATKLNKVLWYTDTFAYRLMGSSVSGETAYVKRQFGPVPKNILKVLRQLEAEGKIMIREHKSTGFTRREFISLKDVNEDDFDEFERKLIGDIVSAICDNHTAASISALSHDIIWDAAEEGEEIPINAVLAARTAEISREDKTWADEIIARRHNN